MSEKYIYLSYDFSVFQVTVFGDRSSLIRSYCFFPKFVLVCKTLLVAKNDNNEKLEDGWEMLKSFKNFSLEHSLSLVREEAVLLIGNMGNISDEMLEQTLDKKLMSNMRIKKSAHERQANMVTSGEWSSGTESPRYPSFQFYFTTQLSLTFWSMYIA